jgi:TonB family protein
LKEYLKENIVDLIQEDSFRKYELAAVKFTINEEGKVIDAHVFESVYQTYENEELNEFLLEAIRHMPRWTPAAYANGTKVKQEFVFTVGDMESCVINLLGICRS